MHVFLLAFFCVRGADFYIFSALWLVLRFFVDNNGGKQRKEADPNHNGPVPGSIMHLCLFVQSLTLSHSFILVLVVWMLSTSFCVHNQRV